MGSGITAQSTLFKHIRDVSQFGSTINFTSQSAMNLAGCGCFLLVFDVCVSSSCVISLDSVTSLLSSSLSLQVVRDVGCVRDKLAGVGLLFS